MEKIQIFSRIAFYLSEGIRHCCKFISVSCERPMLLKSPCKNNGYFPYLVVENLETGNSSCFKYASLRGECKDCKCYVLKSKWYALYIKLWIIYLVRISFPHWPKINQFHSPIKSLKRKWVREGAGQVTLFGRRGAFISLRAHLIAFCTGSVANLRHQNPFTDGARPISAKSAAAQ